jgi:hypothetical protein
MQIAENKYHNTIKQEYKDLVDTIVNSNRNTFHAYTFHRLLSLGLLIDFTFTYVRPLDPEQYVSIELNLKEYGMVIIVIDVRSNYGRVANDESVSVLERFLEDFDTGLNATKKKKGLF